MRDARRQDAAAVARIAHRDFPRTYATSVSAAVIDAVLEQVYSIEALERCIADAGNAAHFLVAEREGSLVGYLDFDGRGHEPQLHRIYVDPELTGLGIGSQLLNELYGRLGPGSSYILMVHEHNTGARRFYARAGFEEAGRADAKEFFSERMGVSFDADAPPARCIVLRRRIGAVLRPDALAFHESRR